MNSTGNSHIWIKSIPSQKACCRTMELRSLLEQEEYFFRGHLNAVSSASWQRPSSFCLGFRFGNESSHRHFQTFRADCHHHLLKTNPQSRNLAWLKVKKTFFRESQEVVVPRRPLPDLIVRSHTTEFEVWPNHISYNILVTVWTTERLSIWIVRWNNTIMKQFWGRTPPAEN